MGLHFGELAKIRGIIFYKLSPHEQKAFAGAIKYGAPNMVRRVQETWLRVVPPFIIAYFVYEWAEMVHHHSTRKNPRDYMFEVDPEAESS